METKQFYKTSEFWAFVATQVGSLVSALAGVLPAKYAALASSVSAGAYAVARGLAKLGVKPEPKENQ